MGKTNKLYLKKKEKIGRPLVENSIMRTATVSVYLSEELEDSNSKNDIVSYNIHFYNVFAGCDQKLNKLDQFV